MTVCGVTAHVIGRSTTPTPRPGRRQVSHHPKRQTAERGGFLRRLLLWHDAVRYILPERLTSFVFSIFLQHFQRSSCPAPARAPPQPTLCFLLHKIEQHATKLPAMLNMKPWIRIPTPNSPFGLVAGPATAVPKNGMSRSISNPKMDRGPDIPRPSTRVFDIV